MKPKNLTWKQTAKRLAKAIVTMENNPFSLTIGDKPYILAKKVLRKDS